MSALIDNLKIVAERISSEAIADIDRLAKDLALAMERAHGGDWRTQIEHDVGLVVVARRKEKGARTRLPVDNGDNGEKRP